MKSWMGCLYLTLLLPAWGRPPGPEADVINGNTPLETRLWQAHPRLFFTESEIPALQAKIRTPAGAAILKRMETWGPDGLVPPLALAYRLTGKREHFESARWMMRHLIDTTPWPEQPRALPPMALYQLALGYDWLYADLDADTQARTRAVLERETRKYFQPLAGHESYYADTYALNLSAQYFMIVFTAAASLYGDVENMGPLLRHALERCRLTADALPADGASAEGMGYAPFFDGYTARSFELCRTLLGLDLFPRSAYFREKARFVLYGNLPAHAPYMALTPAWFGDAEVFHWDPPDDYLYLVAARYRDPLAQWLGDRYAEQRGALPWHGEIRPPTPSETLIRNDLNSYLSLIWHDPTLPATGPENQPLLHRFPNLDVVSTRSDWSSNAAVFAFRCGPHAGYKAMDYRQNISGGHMPPNAGSFLIFAHGDWLVHEGEYTRKWTAYHNTLTINGQGQIGEGADWFECTRLRQEQRAPRLITAQQGNGFDYMVGDATAAYGPETGLTRFRRHIVYWRPASCWAILDELAAQSPATFALYLHGPGEGPEPRQPFVPAGENQWTTRGTRGAARITVRASEPVAGATFAQLQKGAGTHEDLTRFALCVTNTQPRQNLLVLTVIEAYPATGQPAITPDWRMEGRQVTLALPTGSTRTEFELDLEQARCRPVNHPIEKH